jgi:imidazoleglycerol-phosphate dehydratase
MTTGSRTSRVERKTKETQISIQLSLDGSGVCEVSSGIGFLDHMLTAFAMHGRFDLQARIVGDLHISQHHTVEDTGIVLGQAFAAAVGDKAGIKRYGHAYVPMDETLARGVVDLSGRAFAHVDIAWSPNLGPVGFDYALTSEFMWGFARAASATVHVQALYGANNHHMCEASFKAIARALDEATTIDPRLAGALPSTKGAFD